MNEHQQKIQKIVHLVPSFGCGGLEKVIVNLVNNSQGYPVKHVLISLTTDFELAKEFDVPVDVYCIGKKPGNDLVSHFKLYKLLKRINPTAFHTYNFGTIEYHLVAKLTGIATTVHCDHGRGGDDPEGKNKFNNKFRKLISTFINHYTVVSYDLLKWVTEDLGIDRDKVALIFNGVFIPEDSIAKQSGSKLVFTTVGRLDPIKNQKLMMTAFDIAKAKSPLMANAILQLVGNGPIGDELQEYKQTLACKDDIHFLGFRTDIRELLSSSDVFLLSSNYEAMPMTILEAMAEKTPVITTNVGGISKFISSEEVSFVPAKDEHLYSEALIRCATNRDQTKQQIDRAYQLVATKYSVNSMVDNYMRLYKIDKVIEA